ncbi:hypothetical protein, partial [Flavobacterium sp. FlaQc-50]|uniref:hypothetical protein n=1 Tax=unclassified Flavobacterium TaxID=196869 RepID=UPI0037569CCE
LETFRFQFSSFLNQSLNELACFAGCKGKQRFQISQAFLNLFFYFVFSNFSKKLILFSCQSIREHLSCCGCKSSPFIRFYKLFEEVILPFFQSFS